MENLMLFLHIIAWILGVVSTIGAGLLTYGALTYEGSIDEIKDKLQGYTRTFHPLKYYIVAVICWAFIIAF